MDCLIFDAALEAFALLDRHGFHNIVDGNTEIYTNEILMWLSGWGMPELSYLYAPLVFGGVLADVADDSSSISDLLDALHEQRQIRQRVADGNISRLLNTLDAVLEQAKINNNPSIPSRL